MKRKIYLSLILLVIAIGAKAQQFGGGSGTSVDPFLIKTSEHMLQLHDFDWSVSVDNTPYFRLENDIDMKGINWKPINQTDPYSKHLHFDGNGKVLLNLTCLDENYASLFGVLCGSCRNLGLVNVNIRSKNGGGAFGGYLGLVAPASSKYTGIIEKCFSTGRVEGFSAVGGIVGNLGKSKDGIAPIIRNCYSACEVVASYEATTIQAGGARVGGLVGTAWNNLNDVMGVIEKSYSTGTIKASKTYGAGGLIGFSDVAIKQCVAWNDSVINSIASGSCNGKIGYGIAYAHPTNVQSKCQDVWAWEGTVLNLAGQIINRSHFANPSYSYLGNSRKTEELSLFDLNSELKWDFVSEENVWSQESSGGFPILQWMSNRGDADRISGHVSLALSNSGEESGKAYQLQFNSGEMVIHAQGVINKIEIYNIAGGLIYQNEVQNSSFRYPLSQRTGVVVLRILVDNQVFTQKIIL